MTEPNNPFTLLLRLSNGQRMEVAIQGEGGATLDATAITVLKVKESVAVKDPTIPTERQRLIYKGSILENDRCLSDYGIVNGSTLFLVKSAAPSSPATGPSISTTASGPGTNYTTAPGQRTDSNNNNRPQMPMTNPFGQMGQMGNGQQMPNPEQMQQMMNSPQMQTLLDNPDVLGNLMETSMQSPQMQQLMEQNPELRQVSAGYLLYFVKQTSFLFGH
jgi:ubiquilin